MTGAFVRVERKGKFEAIEIEHLTDNERRDLFGHDGGRVLAWLNLVCKELAVVEASYKKGEGVE